MVNRRTNRQPAYSGRGRQKTNRLPIKYLQTGYHDANGIRRWVYADGAKQIADLLARQDRPMTHTSLRRFYNRLQSIKRQYEIRNDFSLVREKLYSGFRPLVMDSVARKVVPEVFGEFIYRNLELAEQNEDNFHAFLEHYQSVLAFARGEQRSSYGSQGAQLPKGYLEQGYFDKNGYLRKELFSDYPEKLVKAFKGSGRSLSFTAMRRFYNVLKALDLRLQLEDTPFASLLPSLYALERDATYALNREVVPQVFKDFIAANINLAIKDEKHLRGFVEHFQAVIAYGRLELKE